MHQNGTPRQVLPGHLAAPMLLVAVAAALPACDSVSCASAYLAVEGSSSCGGLQTV